MSQTKQEEQSSPSATAQTGEESQTGQWSVSKADARDLPVIWPKLLRNIWRGLRRGAGDTLTADDLYFGVMHHDLDLWIIHRGDEILAGVFLRIDKRERGKALIVLNIVSGSAKGFRQYAAYMLPLIREYGQMIGAYTVESVSRPGAARILKSLGCKPKAVIMELSDGWKS